MLLIFLKKSFYYFFSSFINRGIAVLLLPLYTRTLSKVDYGIFDLLIVFGSFANILISFEISQSIYRFYHETKKKKIYSSISLWFSVFSYVIFIIICFFFSKEISTIIFKTDNQIINFRLAIIYISLNGVYILVCNQLRLQGLASFYFNAAVITGITTVITNFILLIVFKLHVEGVFLGLILGLLLGLSYSLLKLRNITYIFSFNFKIFFKMIKFSFPLLPTSILVITTLYLDRYFINYYLSLAEVGVYGVAYRISSLLLLITIGFQLAYTPFFFKIYKEKNSPSVLGNLITFIISLYFMGYLLLSLFSHEIFKIYVGKDFVEAEYIIKYLALSLIFAQFYIFFPGIMIVNKNYIYFVVSFIVFIINIFLNIYLIPLAGLKGAATASLAANSFSAFLIIILSQQYYKILIPWSKLIIFMSLVIFLSLYYSFINIFLINEFFFKIILFLIVIYLFYISKFFPKDFNKILNKF